jgi:predicted transcriptional regulator
MAVTLRARVVRTSDPMWTALEELATRNNRSAAEEARVAIADHLERAGNITITEPPRRRPRRRVTTGS